MPIGPRVSKSIPRSKDRGTRLATGRHSTPGLKPAWLRQNQLIEKGGTEHRDPLNGDGEKARPSLGGIVVKSHQ